MLCLGSADEFNERDEVRGARNATTETYQSDRRGSEHRVMKQFTRVVNLSALP